VLLTGLEMLLPDCLGWEVLVAFDLDRQIALCENDVLPDCFCHDTHLDFWADQRLQSFMVSHYNGHSMVGALERVLVCPPRNAGWDRTGRAGNWRELGFLHAPEFSTAQTQHESMCQQLEGAGAEVIYLRSSDDFTIDAVYAHDVSLPTDFGLILMHPGKSTRVAEVRWHGEFCQGLGIPILGEIEAPGTTEAGDIVWLDSETLLIGHGYRTNAIGIEQMRALLEPKGVEVISAPLPYGSGPSACLHLMSLISLLDEETALVDLPWLAVETVELLHGRGYELIEIDPTERSTLACNVLSLGRRRLLALEENARTNERLKRAGFEVRTFPGSELCINGGGGPTCLTRPLLRN
jgi:N-dimethylarginine dimethylaminohydrolase